MRGNCFADLIKPAQITLAKQKWLLASIRSERGIWARQNAKTLKRIILWMLVGDSDLVIKQKQLHFEISKASRRVKNDEMHQNVYQIQLVESRKQT